MILTQKSPVKVRTSITKAPVATSSEDDGGLQKFCKRMSAKGFSAVFIADIAGYLLNTGTIAEYWTTAPEYYGSFNDDYFDGQTGIYTVPTSGRYSVVANLVVEIDDYDLLRPAPVPIVTLVVTPKSTGIDQVVASAVPAIHHQQLVVSTGEVTNNIIPAAVSSLSINRSLDLDAGDSVRLTVENNSGVLFYLALQPTNLLTNSFSIVKL